MPKDNYTTYCIYRIVCFPNAKMYIGQTNNVNFRRCTHFSELKRNVHENSHLQSAYNKYGKASFYFELLENDIPVDQVSDREVFWIAHFDSFHNGFNQTTGGDKPPLTSKPVVWNGVQYESQSACSIATGISLGTLRHRLKKGCTCDEDVPLRGKQVVWNGIEYSCIIACGQAIGVGHTTMQFRIAKGYTCDADLLKNYKTRCTWNGIEYDSYTDCGNEIDELPTLVREWILKGYTCDDDVPHRKKPTLWNGVYYETQAACAKAVGVNVQRMSKWIKKGYKGDNDLSKRIRLSPLAKHFHE